MRTLIIFCAAAALTWAAQPLDAQSRKMNKNEKTPEVIIHTDLGDIVVRLYNETPTHRDNFLKLAREGFYDSLLFHRVIPGFMIQGGDPNSRNARPGQMLGNGGPGYTLPAEIKPNLFHKRGALAAARMGDNVNPQRRSSGSQFYIVTGRRFTSEELDRIEQRMGTKIPPTHRKVYETEGGAPFLDGAYTVFGEVVKGMDVAEQIAAQPRDRFDRPRKDIHMWMEVKE